MQRDLEELIELLCSAALTIKKFKLLNSLIDIKTTAAQLDLVVERGVKDKYQVSTSK